MEQSLGAHTSVAEGLPKAVDLAILLKFTAMQNFSKNKNRWYAKPLSKKEMIEFKSRLSESGIKFVVVHDSYLINLCSSNNELSKKSRESLIDELVRCETPSIPCLNF